MKDFGRASYLSLQEIFNDEAREFTPWLSENLDRLAKELGFELEADETEAAVGAFRADIKAKTTDKKSVVIENQFNLTDHSHFGQLLTYAAGLEADIVIWIAERVREEHRAAVDWLNTKATDADFFAVEARIVRIDESRPAIFWDVVASPNNWSRTTKKTQKVGGLGTMGHLKINYWAALNTLIDEKGESLTRYKPAKDSWQGGTIGASDIWLNCSINNRDKWIRVEIYIGGSNATEWFDNLYVRREQVEDDLGCALNWDPLETKKACRISVAMDADPGDQADWQRQHEWIIGKRKDFDRVFRPLVREVAVIVRKSAPQASP